MAHRGILGIAMTILIVASAKADPSYTLFDVPGASSTIASGIDNSGTVGGSYTTLKGRCRGGCGYTRASDGTFSTFAVKGCTALQVRGMNASGDMVGFCNAKNDGAFSFVRSADGTISIVKNMKGSTAFLNKIGGNGIAGGYFYGKHNSQPFLRMPDGSKRLLKGARAKTGEVDGINESGISTGEITSFPNQSANAFIYTPDEEIQEFSVPDFKFTLGGAINDSGDVGGLCLNSPGGGPLQGFLRSADGSFDVFDIGVGENGNAYVAAIATVGADRQVIGMTAKDGFNAHWIGFVHHENGTLETFDISNNKAPGGSLVMSASENGVVVGYYVDHHGDDHAFIRMP